MSSDKKSESMRPPDLFQPPFRIHVFDQLDSTNTFLKANQVKLPDYTVIFTRNQTAGRGRFDRQWRAAPGRDLCASILLPMSDVAPPYRRCLPNIPQMTALSVCRMLQKHGVQPAVKWPNDVLVSGLKICGILCEVVRRPSVDAIVVGVGINLNSTARELADIGRPATSLMCETGCECDPQAIMLELLGEISSCFEVFCQAGFAGICASVRALLTGLDRPYRLTLPDGEHIGLIVGIDDSGALQFNCEKCGLMTVHSGELTACAPASPDHLT